MSNMMLGQMPTLDPKLSMLLEHAPRWMANNSLNGLMQPSQFLQPNHLGIPGLIDAGDRNQYNHIDGKSVSLTRPPPQSHTINLSDLTCVRCVLEVLMM